MKFFTDDILKGSVISSFDGFTPLEYNEDTQVIKFKLNDNTIIDAENNQHTMTDLITPYRKKRFCLFFEDNVDLIYDKNHEFCILNGTKPEKEITLVVTEGKLDIWHYKD